MDCCVTVNKREVEVKCYSLAGCRWEMKQSEMFAQHEEKEYVQRKWTLDRFVVVVFILLFSEFLWTFLVEGSPVHSVPTALRLFILEECEGQYAASRRQGYS